MKTPTTTSKLTVATIRELKKQLVFTKVKPTKTGVFFMVTTKANVRRVLKSFGFTKKEIREIMKRVEKNHDRTR